MAFKFGKLKKLTTIKSGAFRKTNPTSIDFEGCDLLQIIGNASLDNGAFEECVNLETVSFKNCGALITIGSRMFAKDTLVENIDFTGCTNLDQIAQFFLNDNCETSERHNTKLKKLDLTPCTSLRLIGANLAANCDALEEVDMHGLTNLVSIGTPYRDSEADFGWNYSCGGFGNYSEVLSSLTKIDLSGCSSLEYIPFGFAHNCTKLTTVDLTGCTSLIVIGQDSFYNCVALETITGWNDAKATIKEIRRKAFGKCGVLNIDISNMPVLEYIKGQWDSQGAFYTCTAMKSCPNNCPSLKEIGGAAFRNCTNLGLNADGSSSTLDLSNNANLEKIGVGAFTNVEHIETVKLDNDVSLTTIDNSAFQAPGLKHFTATNCTALTYLGSNVFGYNNLPVEKATLEDIDFSGCTALSNMEYEICSSCINLTSAKFKDCVSLPKIGNGSFYNCKKLVEADFTNCSSLNEIGGSAFGMCKALPYFTWSGDTLKKIGDSAFAYDESLKSVKFLEPCDITEILWGAFNGTKCEDGIELADLVFPNLTKMERHAFNLCTLIKSFNASGAPLTITGDVYGGRCFYGCKNLESVNFSNCSSLATLQECLLAYCTKLKTADFTGCALTDIRNEVFCYCAALEECKLDLSEAAACTIGMSAFGGLRNQASGVTPSTEPLNLYIKCTTPPTIYSSDSRFINGINNANTPGLATIHFSAAAETDYKAAARLAEDSAVGHTGDQKDVVWYWCCSNGQCATDTGGTAGNLTVTNYGWYATNVAGAPSIVFDL